MPNPYHASPNPDLPPEARAEDYERQLREQATYEAGPPFGGAGPMDSTPIVGTESPIPEYDVTPWNPPPQVVETPWDGVEQQLVAPTSQDPQTAPPGVKSISVSRSSSSAGGTPRPIGKSSIRTIEPELGGIQENLSGYVDDERSAKYMEGRIAGLMGEEGGRTLKAGAAALAKSHAATQKLREEADASAKKYMQGLMSRVENHRNMKVDDDFFGRSTTGSKIGMIASALLGGWMNPRQNGTSPAIALIERAIERDIRNQEKAIAKVGRDISIDREMFADSRALTKSSLEARDLHAARLWGSVQRMWEAEAVKYKGQIGEERAMAAAAVAGQKKERLKLEIYNKRKDEEFREKKLNAEIARARRQAAAQSARLAFEKDKLAFTRGRAKLVDDADARRRSVHLPSLSGGKNVLMGRMRVGIDKISERKFREGTALRVALAMGMDKLKRLAAGHRSMPAGFRKEREKIINTQYGVLFNRYQKYISGVAVSAQEQKWLKSVFLPPKGKITIGDVEGAWNNFTESVMQVQEIENADALEQGSDADFNLQEYFLPENIVGTKFEDEGSYKESGEAITSGDPEEIDKTHRQLMENTEASKFKETTETSPDTLTTIGQFEEGLVAMKAKFESDAFQPPHAPKPPKTKGKALNAWLGKRDAAVAAQASLARHMGRTIGYSKAYGVSRPDDAIDIDEIATEWMSEKDSKLVWKAYHEGLKRGGAAAKKTSDKKLRSSTVPSFGLEF